MPVFDYFYPEGADQFTFYRIPKRLFTDADLKSMSNGSKILYGLLLDRVDLSVRNKWMDERRRIYVIYTLESIMQAMNVTDKPATKMLVELEDRGLIERVKPGLGKPTRLYVKNFSSRPENIRLQTRKNSDSGVGESTTQDSEIFRSNYININDTDRSDTDPFLSGEDAMERRKLLEQYFKDQLSYGDLVKEYPREKEMIDGILTMIVDTCSSNRQMIRIAGDDKPAAVVQGQFMKLTGDHIRFVLQGLKNNTTQVRNIRQYLMGSLYNAPLTIDAFYTAQVNHDLYGTDENEEGSDAYG